MKSGTFFQLPIGEVEIDTRNPRIRRFLEIYDGQISEDEIELALNVTGESAESGMKDSTTPAKLSASIIANGGIRYPIETGE